MGVEATIPQGRFVGKVGYLVSMGNDVIPAADLKGKLSPVIDRHRKLTPEVNLGILVRSDLNGEMTQILRDLRENARGIEGQVFILFRALNAIFRSQDVPIENLRGIVAGEMATLPVWAEKIARELEPRTTQ